MDKETMQLIIRSSGALVDSLAKVTNTTGKHIYDIFIKQQYIQAIADGIIIVAIVVITIVYSKLFPKIYLKAKAKNRDGTSYSNIAIGFMLLISFITVIAIFVLTNSFKHILNPEYYALKTIFHTLNIK